MVVVHLTPCVLQLIELAFHTYWSEACESARVHLKHGKAASSVDQKAAIRLCSCCRGFLYCNRFAVQAFMLSNSQPFPASYKWTLAEGTDSSVWRVSPAVGQLGGPSTEEVTVRWTPKPNAPPGETEVQPSSFPLP